MAIYHSVLFDSLRNKLSNTVLYKKGPDGIIRTRPAKVRNPRTPEQQTQRARMKAVIDLSRIFAPAITVGFCNRPARLTVYNMFTKENVKNVNVDDQFQGTVQMENLVLSNGILTFPKMEVEKEGDQIHIIHHKETADGMSAGDDQIYCAIYIEGTSTLNLIRLCTRAEEKEEICPIPEDLRKNTRHVYVFAVSRTKKRTSVTKHF